VFLKGENVGKDAKDGVDFHDNWNHAFGERPHVRTGRYYYVDGVAVHEDDMKSKEYKSRVLIKTRSEIPMDCLPEVTFHEKGAGGAPKIRKVNVGKYRTV
jgi:hypothetical protein